MSIRKEDLHQLVELVNEHEVKFVYDLIKGVLEKDLIVETDNSPLTEQEINLIKENTSDINSDELIDWDDING